MEGFLDSISRQALRIEKSFVFNRIVVALSLRGPCFVLTAHARFEKTGIHFALHNMFGAKSLTHPLQNACTRELHPYQTSVRSREPLLRVFLMRGQGS